MMTEPTEDQTIAEAEGVALIEASPAEAAATHNPRSALVGLVREVVCTLAGGELAHGELCTTCTQPLNHDDLRDRVRASLQCLGVAGPITNVDLEDTGRLGPYGEVSTHARQMENEAEYGIAYRVREFHHKFGHMVRRKPGLPTDREARHRARLVTEEYLEFMAAIFPSAGALSAVAGMIRATIESAEVKVNLPELEDAMQDIDYVIEGTRATCGIDREKGARVVHAANMAKAPVLDAKGQPDPTSKPTKPAGWKAPDMAVVLREQGWGRFDPITGLPIQAE